MGIGSLLGIGYSGMGAAKTSIATSGHNIANATTEGFSRQRLMTENAVVTQSSGQSTSGNGVKMSRVERLNDHYLERQIRGSTSVFHASQERDFHLRHLEDVYNEMSGDGLNRLVSRFFNDFRRLSLDPESGAYKEAVRESAQAMVNDFHRLSEEMRQMRGHMDARLNGYIEELNVITAEVSELNLKIRQADVIKTLPPNDLLDKRDSLLKKMSELVGCATYYDNQGRVQVEIKGAGPLVMGIRHETLRCERTANSPGNQAVNSMDIFSSISGADTLTHQISEGKIGGLISVRDGLLGEAAKKLDQLAFELSSKVNQVHQKGVTGFGDTGISFFEPLDESLDAAIYLRLSDEVIQDSENICTGKRENARGDNRIALEIANLQTLPMHPDSPWTFDQEYDSILSEIGVQVSRNSFQLSQQEDILGQLQKFREQISGVSVDEETANLVQMQHVYDASAKVVSVADELLRTVIGLVKDR